MPRTRRSRKLVPRSTLPSRDLSNHQSRMIDGNPQLPMGLARLRSVAKVFPCTSAKPCQKPRIPDRACSNYYSLGTQSTSADEPTLFPHVLTDPEARPKTDPGVHKRLQNHGEMLSPEYRRSGRVRPCAGTTHPKKKIPQKQKSSQRNSAPVLES